MLGAAASQRSIKVPYKPGDWKFVCDLCGRDGLASQAKRNWKGQWVHPEHWEPRHPQDFVRGVPETITPPWTRPRQADTYAAFCTPAGITAIADYAVADCAIAEYTHPAFDPNITYS